MKKLSLVLMLAVTLVFLCSCVTCPIDQIYNINEDGSGTATYSVYFMHDFQFEPWDLDMTNEVVQENDGMFPKGTQAAMDYLETVKPDYITLDLETSEVYDVLSFTVHFDSVEDFNEKAKILSDDSWQDQFAATMEITDENGQRTLKFNAPFALGEPMVSWAYDLLLQNPDVFYNWERVQTDLTAVKAASVTVAGKTEAYWNVMDDANWGNADAADSADWAFICTGSNTFAYEAPVVEEPVVEEVVVEEPVVEEVAETPVAQAPQTFDAAVIAAVAAVVSLAGYAVSKKR